MCDKSETLWEVLTRQRKNLENEAEVTEEIQEVIDTKNKEYLSRKARASKQRQPRNEVMWNVSSIATRGGLPKPYRAHNIPHPQSLNIETQDIMFALLDFDRSLLLKTSVILFKIEAFILCLSLLKVSNLPFKGHSFRTSCVSEEILNLDF